VRDNGLNLPNFDALAAIKTTPAGASRPTPASKRPPGPSHPKPKPQPRRRPKPKSKPNPKDRSATAPPAPAGATAGLVIFGILLILISGAFFALGLFYLLRTYPREGTEEEKGDAKIMTWELDEATLIEKNNPELPPGEVELATMNSPAGETELEEALPEGTLEQPITDADNDDGAPPLPESEQADADNDDGAPPLPESEQLEPNPEAAAEPPVDNDADVP